MFIFSPPEVNNCIVLAAKKSILSIDLEECVINSLNLPENRDPVEADDEDDSRTAYLSPCIQSCAVSKDHLAVTTNDKSLLLFSITKWHPLEANLVAERKIPRVSSAIRFAEQHLFVADKSGDCTVYDCTNDELPEKQIGGHLSIVTDILLTQDEKFFITCDRDEKIRVTNYPGCHEIESYCLGHREFVAQIDLLPHNPKILVSLSGDSTLRFWDFQHGKEFHKIDLPGAGIKMASRASGIDSIFAVYINETDSLVILKVSGSQELQHKILKTIPLDDLFVCSLAISATHLLALGVSQSGKNHPKIVAIKLDDWTFEDFRKQNDTLQERLGSFSDSNPGDAVAGLFKKKYSNIVEYHERKRKRLEAKEAKL